MSFSSHRIVREQKTIRAMLRIYCRDHHGSGAVSRVGVGSTDTPGRPVPVIPLARTAPGLCPDCASLLDYSHQRLEVCPFQETKPVCNFCEVHCYSKRMRERVQAVMRYAGPRMLWRHPWLSLGHVLDKLRPVPKLKRKQGRPAAQDPSPSAK